MTDVFVDTSGFYALLDATDTFHREAALLFSQAAASDWTLHTTNYVIVESTALIQARLGWDALDAWTRRVLPHCRIGWVTPELHQRGESRWVHTRERRLSLTDCISFEYMREHNITNAIAQDEHFTRQGFSKPTG